MRKRMVSAALALCLALTLFSGTALAAGEHPFTDVPQGHWAGDAVQYVYENNLMGGTDSTTFSPNATTTRGMIVTVLYRLTGEPASGTASQFTDVAAGAWYAKAVAWAASRDIVNGTSATTFSPNSPITREQLAVIFYRYAQDQGWDVSAWTDLGLYQDAAQVSRTELAPKRIFRRTHADAARRRGCAGNRNLPQDKRRHRGLQPAGTAGNRFPFTPCIMRCSCFTSVGVCPFIMSIIISSLRILYSAQYFSSCFILLSKIAVSFSSPITLITIPRAVKRSFGNKVFINCMLQLLIP